jgi:ribosomal protein S18 acetylase RimI-like enzyme
LQSGGASGIPFEARWIFSAASLCRSGSVLKITRMLLEVEQSNHHAIEFYKRNGFRIISERKNYLPKPKRECLGDGTVDVA